MPANQNFAKRTGECMKDVKPEYGRVRTCTHAPKLPGTSAQLHTPPHASEAARLPARFTVSFMALVVPHLRPHPSPLAPHPPRLA
jgi:hypothetical protein